MIEAINTKYIVGGLAVFAFVILLQKTREWVALDRRIIAHGAHPPRYKSWVPFGFVLITRTIAESIWHHNLENWTKKLARHGPHCHTVETRLGGPLGIRLIFTNDAQNVKAILAAQFDDYFKGKMFHDDWEALLGDGIFTSDGEVWRSSRQLIRTQFVKERVSDLGTFEKHLQVLISCIKRQGHGQEIDMSQLFQRFTLDAATDFLFGRSVNNLTTPNAEFAEAFGYAQNRLKFISSLGPIGACVSRKKLNGCLKVINDFIEPYIDEALALSPEELETKSKKESTFLHSLASFTRDRKVLRDQIMSLLLAGRDTTASALSWTFYELGRHPEVVKKLRTEIINTVGLNREPTYDDLKNMKYLQYAMNETLRLYPSVPVNLRIARHDTTLPSGGGPNLDAPIGILKDNLVVYSPVSLHRREDLYPPSSNPSVYNPDRWQSWQPKPWDYIPFNGGPRICPGQQFALTEMGYTIVRLLQEFDTVVGFMDYEKLDESGMNLKFEVVLQPRFGVKIGFLRS